MKNMMKKIFRNWKSSVLFFVLVALVAFLVFAMIFGMIKRSVNKNKVDQESSVEEFTEPPLPETAPVPFTEPAIDENEITQEESVEETEEETEEMETEDIGESDGISENYEHLFVVKGAETLNIRKTPSTDGTIIAALPEFAGGNVIEKTEDNEWYHITSGTVEGYVSASFVVVGQEATELSKEHAEKRIRVTEEVVNIRAEASTDSEVLGSANENSVFTYVSEENGFYKIHYDAEKDAFISMSCASAGWYLQEAIPVDYDEDDEDEDDDDSDDKTADETVSTSGQAQSVTAGSNGLIVCIDAGHQAHGISATEPNGPGSGTMKAKLTTGTAGCSTGRAEHVVNLEVSLLLQQELQNRGYTVVMIRTSADCPLSNAERAQVANNAGANCFIRVHCNSSGNPDVRGIMTYAPSGANPYLSQDIIGGSNALAGAVLNSMCAATGWQNRGLLQDDTMTGINWCKVPVTIVEMGFMSNPTDDQMLSDPSYQALLAKGMADGIDAYFGR